MPTMKRHKTNYPGVFYVDGTDDQGKPERIFYIRYRRDGRAVEEKAGRQFQNDMTAAKANLMRSERITGRSLSNRETRNVKNETIWTLQKLFDAYIANREGQKSSRIDKYRFQKYLSGFSGKLPSEIDQTDINRLEQLFKKNGVSNQTKRHVYGLLFQAIGFGVKKKYCLAPLIERDKITVKNERDDALDKDQVNALLKAINESENIHVAAMMKLALFTGMRRGELFNLKWTDVDMNTGLLTIRLSKSGEPQKIVLNDHALDVLRNHPKKSEYVFPGGNGGRRVECNTAARKIMRAANIPDTVRPMHSLRHTFASLMAGSGKFQMHGIQKMLTHASVTQTERYTSYRDAALKKYSDISNEVFDEIMKNK